MSSAIAVSVRHARKTYGDLKAVDDLSFDIPAGSCFGLLGPNGAGKTTMMKMLFARTDRDGGEDTVINVLGYDPVRDELAVKSLTGIVPQENNLDTEVDVLRNLLIYSGFYGIPRKTARERIEKLLDFMDLKEKAKSKIKELSGGMFAAASLFVTSFVNNINHFNFYFTGFLTPQFFSPESFSPCRSYPRRFGWSPTSSRSPI